MARPPDAFLSYTRFDDRHDGGAISELRRRLASAVRAVTGKPFEIFQDVDGIGLGEKWRGKLDQLLDEARFFIPILTPSFFTSEACRDELGKFLRAEVDRGRSDLVLPIYYIECDVLENPDFRATDPLATAIHERQRQDWRDLRFEAFEGEHVRRALEHLAREIVRALRRTMPQGPAPPTAPRDASAKRRVRAEEAEAKRWTEAEASERPEGEPRPGTIFRDIEAPWCPEMVVVSRGEFMMGATEAECQWALERGSRPEWLEREKPQHRVRIADPLAVGRCLVTFEEYERFCEAAGQKRPDDEGWGRGRRPVIDVSWNDGKAYVEWLASETGQTYRLLSEAEWEHACRAGTTTRYSWGDDVSPENANFGATIGKTTEVGGYPPNSWGLYDMHGNVWEWVEDCWNRSYEGAPDDGSAWTSGDCRRRVLRGGSWNLYPGGLRSACRFRNSTGYRYSNRGFRVARTLSRSES